jgi:23S rRNA (adenine-N6)-dimethyltransferase
VAVRRHSSRGARGQHFLRSRKLAADIVAAAGLGRGDLVVEIGGGTGVLTTALAEAGARVRAVERDPVLAAGLRARFDRCKAVEIVEADGAECEWPVEPFAVVGNLPFARSGAILERLLRDPSVPLQRALVIVQWELGAKHSAVWPSTLRANYWRAWYDVSIDRRLDRTAFAPPPSVDAAVLRLERRNPPRLPVELHEDYRVFLRTAFAAHGTLRRALQPSLSPLQTKRLAPALGFSPDTRARDLDAEQWVQLFTASRHARGRR